MSAVIVDAQFCDAHAAHLAHVKGKYRTCCCVEKSFCLRLAFTLACQADVSQSCLVFSDSSMQGLMIC